jgi:ribosome-associated toxin RatA of RatAB toxin-antitoxin module
MPTDRSVVTVVVNAPFYEVLAAVRDVESQEHWVKEIHESDVLEEYEDGTPATARFTMVTGVGSDTYTLEYAHADDAMAWSLVEAQMMKAQNGRFDLRDLGDGSTEVTLNLEVDHGLPAPGFLRRRVLNRFTAGIAQGLKTHLEN